MESPLWGPRYPLVTVGARAFVTHCLRTQVAQGTMVTWLHKHLLRELLALSTHGLGSLTDNLRVCVCACVCVCVCVCVRDPKH